MTMAFDDIPLMSMLKSRFGYLSQQQRGIGVNVANSDTPGFVPQDLKPFRYSAPSHRITPTGAGGAIAPGASLALAPVQTQAMHLSGRQAASGQTWKAEDAPDSEAQLNGNQVVLEEQMMKMAKARGDYDAAINFYEKSVSMIQLALKPPGKP
jgi:flagellar basal-body rod protein FlgB